MYKKRIGGDSPEINGEQRYFSADGHSFHSVDDLPNYHIQDDRNHQKRQGSGDSVDDENFKNNS